MPWQGYIKLYRQIMDSEIWKDPYKLRLWELCLMKANHSEKKQVIGNQVISLKSAQFVTGRKALCDEYNEGLSSKHKLTESTVDRWLKLFEKDEMLSIEHTNKYSIVTINNWSKYQDEVRTTNEQQMNTNKNEKNVKNDKEINNKCRFTPPTLDEVTAYCKERNNGIDSQAFIDYYESVNWKVGKKKMVDWKACVRTWERRNKTSSKISVNADDRTLPEWYTNQNEEFEQASDEEIEEFKKMVERLGEN